MFNPWPPQFRRSYYWYPFSSRKLRGGGTVLAQLQWCRQGTIGAGTVPARFQRCQKVPGGAKLVPEGARRGASRLQQVTAGAQVPEGAGPVPTGTYRIS